MKVGKYLVLVIIQFSCIHLKAAILLDETGSSRIRSKAPIEGMRMRSARKIGLGTEFSGPLGLVALKAEINLSHLSTIGAGAGLGPGFQTFGFELKRVIGGNSFVPFIAGGFSRWYSVLREGQSLQTSTPAFFASRFLSEQERLSGDFAKSFVYPSIGVQYYQLNGAWQGASVYAQILMLIEIQRLNSAPTGSVGFLYFF